MEKEHEEESGHGPPPGRKLATETLPSPAVVAFIQTDTAKLLMAVSGILASLMLYGVMQERIMRVPYGDERFEYSLLLVLCNRLLTCSVCITAILTQGKKLAPVAPIYAYSAVSLSNVIATTCQYEALKYVSFPVQTLAKCAKMMPVMVWGTLIMQKKYGWKDYVIAVSVTAGCSVFVLTGESTKSHKSNNDSLWGIILMLGYLGTDGFTSTFQDKLFKGYSMDIFNQVLYVGLCSSVISLIGLFASGQLLESLAFVIRNPDCLWNIILLSAAATTGQFFISYTIRTFGALVFATVMTTRQFLSILLSCLLFAHPLTLGQWVGTVMVFASLYYNTYRKKQSSSRSSDSRGDEKTPLTVKAQHGFVTKDLEMNRSTYTKDSQIIPGAVLSPRAAANADREKE